MKRSSLSRVHVGNKNNTKKTYTAKQVSADVQCHRWYYYGFLYCYVRHEGEGGAFSAPASPDAFISTEANSSSLCYTPVYGVDVRYSARSPNDLKRSETPQNLFSSLLLFRLKSRHSFDVSRLDSFMYFSHLARQTVGDTNNNNNNKHPAEWLHSACARGSIESRRIAFRSFPTEALTLRRESKIINCL